MDLRSVTTQVTLDRLNYIEVGSESPYDQI